MLTSLNILGSTGSIGLTTLNLIDKRRKLFKINLLSSNKNYQLILNQIKKYKPAYYVITNYYIFNKIKKKLVNNKTQILNSFDDLDLKKKTDISITAIPGVAGLRPTIKIIKFSKKVLIANKESIICGWNLIKKNSVKNKTQVIPLDSEHYSIFKLLENNKISEIEKIFITASGGPFLNYKPIKFKKIKPKQALKHPKWKMGKKISIDSATMMNKILEFAEAQKLFNIPNKKLEILIHPESLVHAIIKLKNGLVKFVYHETSMKIPIINAIFDGNLQISNYLGTKKNFIKNLTFSKVNPKIFPAIILKDKINQYPASSIIISAANEVLVDHFLREKIPFTSIFKIIMAILKDQNYKKYAIKSPKNINQIHNIDEWSRKKTLEKIYKL